MKTGWDRLEELERRYETDFLSLWPSLVAYLLCWELGRG